MLYLCHFRDGRRIVRASPRMALSSEHRTVRSTWAATLALFCGAVLLYLSSPARVFYWDGVAFSIAIEKALHSTERVFHPNHLLYEEAGLLLLRVTESLGVHVRALFLLQAANAVLAAAALAVMHRLLLKADIAPRPAALFAAAMMGSAAWWRYATDVDAYIPAVLLMLLAALELYRRIPPRVWVVALWHTLAMLFHQLSIWLAPVIVWQLLRDRRVALSKRLRRVVTYSMFCAAVVTGVYVLAYRSQMIHSQQFADAAARPSFLAWVTSHSDDSSFSFRLGYNLKESLMGFVRLGFGGKLPGRRSVEAAAWLWAGLVIALVLLLATLWVRRGRLRSLFSVSVWMRLKRDPLPLIWLAVYTVFLFVWLPQNVFYRLFYLPAVVLLLAYWHASTEIGGASAKNGELTSDEAKIPELGAASVSRAASPLSPAPSVAEHSAPFRVARTFRLGLPSLVFVLGLANFVCLIYPNSKEEANPPLQFALKEGAAWPAGTRVAFARFHPDLWTISYFTPQVSWFGWDAHRLEQLESYAQKSDVDHQPLWLDDSAFDELRKTESGRQWLNNNRLVSADISVVHGKNNYHFYATVRGRL